MSGSTVAFFAAIKAGAAGSLTQSTITYNAENLTTSALLDWICYRASPVGSNDDRQSTNGLITGPTLSNMTRTAGTGSIPLLNWTNGTLNPTGNNNNENGHWDITSTLSAGYIEHTVPADTTSRTCVIDLATFTVSPTVVGNTNLRLTLSDSSALEILLTVPTTDSTLILTRYQILYKAGSAAQNLRIRVENPVGANPQNFIGRVSYK